MRILVLGATGFIGGHIAKAALKEGWSVRGMRRNPSNSGHVEGLPIEWVGGNLKDPASLETAMHGIDVVFHAAAYYPRSGEKQPIKDQIIYALNEIENVIQAARKVNIEKLIFTSTLTTIGKPPADEKRIADETDFYIPGSLEESAYYETKIAMETRILEAAKQGLPALVLIPTAVFGPGEVNPSIGRLLILVARGWGIGWLPATTNVVDVRDVAIAHIQAAKQGKLGGRYIIGGHNLSVKEAITIAAQVSGVKPPYIKIPFWILDALVKLGDWFPNLPLPSNHLRAVRHWQPLNNTKAIRDLGLFPRPFEDTVIDAITWFKSQRLL
ncbi:MAG: NAD-dependent epimerase/dehydratase family protein [Chloroflexi bacterium]|nr:NAD-dependent epimerase/dehydratase family protein [Chloroflexota bacterium]